MSINIGPPEIEELRPRITVIGVGGAGGNAIANMIAAQVEGVEFVVANTDAQALNSSVAEQKIQLGPDITQGLGAGSRAEVGRAAAEETLDEIERVLDGVHMVFVAAGMGGGTGTGAAPIIAKAARDKGVLTVGVVTKPFLFEGTRRMRAAEAGIEELQEHVDTLIVIPNQNLFLIAKAETTFKEAFQLADEVLQQGVRSITDLMVMPGLINLDFADVRSVMGEMGKAMMGTGEGEGENRALEAAERAIANPLLDGVSMQGARGVIISILGGEDMKLLEVDEAANHIRELVDSDANIIWGSAFNPELEGKIRVSVVATGIEQAAAQSGDGARPLNLGMSRGPVRPAANEVEEPEPIEEEAPAAEKVQPLFEAQSDPEPEEDTAPARMPEPIAEPEPEADVLNLSDAQPEEEDEPAQETPIPLQMNVSNSTQNDQEEEGEGEDESSSSTYASLMGVKSTSRADPLDLDLEQAEGTGDEEGGGSGDDLLGNADQLNDDDRQVAASGSAGGGGDTAGGAAPAASGDAGKAAAAAGDSGPAGDDAARPPAGGSTLFERMANLSRGASKEDEDEDGDEDGEDGEAGSINIPRFLGRQNNQ